MIAKNCRKILVTFSLWHLLLSLGDSYDNRSIFSSAMSVASAASSASPSVTVECAVVGVGVLGTSLCKQLLRDPDLKDWKVTGFTKSDKRHSDILKEVLGDDEQYADRFELRMAGDGESGKKFNHCVFCAPPSGFEDYPAAVKESIDNLWMGQTEDNANGAFVFTSSGGIFGSGGDDVDVSPVVTESSPLPSTITPRIEKLVNAEKVVTKQKGGFVLRLAGLYLLDRGAHNFWLGDTKELAKAEVGGRADGMINLLHYDDAAGASLAALKNSIKGGSSASEEGRIFLVSDGHPQTRQQICEASLKNKRYADRTIPKFTGSIENGDPIGKVYDGSYTNEFLEWSPMYESFDKFMSS